MFKHDIENTFKVHVCKVSKFIHAVSISFIYFLILDFHLIPLHLSITLS